MTENVLMFDDLDDERQIAAAHLGLPRIILEGKSDVTLFKRYWFQSYVDSAEFVEAADLVQGSGCTAVAAAVRKSVDEDGIPAIGLVDRDWLFKTAAWDRLFDSDDEAFEAAAAGEDYYTAKRWEIEAYLLEPDLLEPIVRSYSKDSPRPEAECSAGLGKAVEESRAMLRAQFFYCANHAAGQALVPQHLIHKLAADLEQECEALMDEVTAPEGLAAAAKVRGLVADLLAAEPDTIEDRWRSSLRFVDTKRLMSRLQAHLRLVGEIKWILAEMMKATGRKPAELEARIRQLVA